MAGFQQYPAQQGPECLMLRFLLAIGVGIILCHQTSAQVVYQPTTTSVYEFIDELANLKLIEINSAVKPYSRKLIANHLQAVSDSLQHELNVRQREELAYYLRDFGKELKVGKDWNRRWDLFYHSDSVFQVTVNPLGGGRSWLNDNGLVFQRTIGGEAWATFGKHVGAYVRLRDSGVNQIFSATHHLTTMDGQNYKYNQGELIDGQRSDFSELRAGIHFSWEWGSIGLVKDRIEWGNSYRNANIFSGRAPSYIYLDLKLHPTPWFEFNYIHGWLVSEELDSARTYLTPHGQRKVFMNKNIAANLFTIKPVKNLFVSVGNSIVYSETGFQPVYFIPFMLFRAVDHTYSGTGSNEVGQNAQIFADVSVRCLKKLHWYATWFIDEVSISNMFKPDQHTNIWSIKSGLRYSNILPNLDVTVEYTQTNPWAYRHQIESTTFASNQYNLGHYLGENSREIYGELTYRPFRRVKTMVFGALAEKGPEHEYDIIHGNANVTGLNFMESTDWRSLELGFRVEYEVVHDARLYLGAAYRSVSGNPQYAHPYFQGETLTIQAGAFFGF